MIKIVSSFLLIAIAGGFLINQVPSWKQSVIEVINPAAKETRLLGELMANLEDLESSLNPSNSQAEGSSELVSKSKKLVNEIASINQKSSGIIRQQVGKIIDAFLDKTPYPADHLRAKSVTSSPLVCPPVK